MLAIAATRSAGPDAAIVELARGSAEEIPYDDGSFDVVVTRIAPHHFADIRAAVEEMARVSNRLVVVEDTLYANDQVEEAEKLRDPSHVRSYSEEEWRDLIVDAGLEVERVEYFEKTHETDEWLARTDCTGENAQRVRELLAPLSEDGGRTWRDTKLILKARKSQK
jgi:SAM-dependent methyltransferase